MFSLELKKVLSSLLCAHDARGEVERGGKGSGQRQQVDKGGRRVQAAERTRVDEVVGKLLSGKRALARLDAVVVVGDDDSLEG